MTILHRTLRRGAMILSFDHRHGGRMTLRRLTSATTSIVALALAASLAACEKPKPETPAKAQPEQVTAAACPPASATAPEVGIAALTAKAQSEGSIRVIVRLASTVQPAIAT